MRLLLSWLHIFLSNTRSRNKIITPSWVLLNSAISQPQTKLRSHVRHSRNKTFEKLIFYSIDRKKVLKHHPDKKASSTTESTNKTSSLLGLTTHQNTNDDAFFKCIQKAHEVLTNAERRRQFDSVDPAFLEQEEDLTGITEKEFKVLRLCPAYDITADAFACQSKKLNFFKTFAPIYDLYARFSRVQPVPVLGKLDATKAEVEGFYDFWYNFDSWRSFEWLDKEVNEGSDKYVLLSITREPDTIFNIAGTTRDTPRRRINPSARGERRRILQSCVASLTSPSGTSLILPSYLY